MKLKSKIILSVFLLFLMASAGYYYLIISPKNELQKLSSRFEIALRENNLSEFTVNNRLPPETHLKKVPQDQCFTNYTTTLFVPSPFVPLAYWETA